jgi:hypothetical protein
MGITYLFTCQDCNHTAEVSGGPDRGFVAKTETMKCNDCRDLFDGPVLRKRSFSSESLFQMLECDLKFVDTRNPLKRPGFYWLLACIGLLLSILLGLVFLMLFFLLIGISAAHFKPHGPCLICDNKIKGMLQVDRELAGLSKLAKLAQEGLLYYSEDEDLFEGSSKRRYAGLCRKCKDEVEKTLEKDYSILKSGLPIGATKCPKCGGRNIALWRMPGYSIHPCPKCGGNMIKGETVLLWD